MSRRTLTPHEKKQLSLARDYRDISEYPKALRRIKPRRKQGRARSERRGVHMQLEQVLGREPQDAEILAVEYVPPRQGLPRRALQPIPLAAAIELRGWRGPGRGCRDEVSTPVKRDGAWMSPQTRLARGAIFVSSRRSRPWSSIGSTSSERC